MTEYNAEDTVEIENTSDVSTVSFTDPDATHQTLSVGPGETAEVFLYQALKSDRVEIQEDIPEIAEFDPDSGEAVLAEEPSEQSEDGESDDESDSDTQGEDDESGDFDRVFSKLPHLNEDDNLEEIQDDFEDADDFFENVEESDLKKYSGIGDVSATEIMSQVQG